MTHLLRRCFSSILVGGLLVLAQGQAQAVRIGVVDPDRILREANSAASMRLKLQQEFSAREKSLMDQGAALKARIEAFERETPTLSESQRASRQRQLADQDLEFQRGRRALQEDLDTRTNEELQRLMARTNLIVKQVAESEKFDLVLQQAVYINPRNDLTSKVLRILNSETPK